MSGLTNQEIIANQSFSYLLAVMILVLIVLVYQVYYIILPKLSRKVDGFAPGPSYSSELSDRGPPGTVVAYGADSALNSYTMNQNSTKSGFFGGGFEPPVFWPEGEENAYRSARNQGADNSTSYVCPPGVILNSDGSCPVAMISGAAGFDNTVRSYKNADGSWVSCGKNMKVNSSGNGCIEGAGKWQPLGGSSGFGRRDGMTNEKKIAAAIGQMY